MKHLLSLSVIIALGAGGVQAKASYCQDPTTHKRISCKTVPAAASAPTKPLAATTPTATVSPAPAKKPSMFAGTMKPKTAPGPAAPTGTPVPMMSKAPGQEAKTLPRCVRGKLCGMSCIKATDICHKPS